MSGPIQAVLFDLGKVLVDYDWTHTLERIARELGSCDSAALREWLEASGGVCEQYGRGRIEGDAFLEAMQRRFDAKRQSTSTRLRTLWCDMFLPMPGALDVVDALRGSVHLGLVSNTNAMHFEWLDQRLRLRSRFDGLTLSHHVGSLKPEPAIYEHALAAAACDPTQAVFVDDLPENVAAACTLGLHGIVFVSVPRLRADLAASGLLV